MRRNPSWLYAELNRSNRTHTHTHTSTHTCTCTRTRTQTGHGKVKLGLHLCIMPKPQNTRTHAHSRRAAAAVGFKCLSSIYTSVGSFFAATRTLRVLAEGGQVGGNTDTYIKKKRNKKKQASILVKTMPCRRVASRCGCGCAWRMQAGHGYCGWGCGYGGRGVAWCGWEWYYIHIYLVKRVHDIQITTNAAQLQQQRRRRQLFVKWRHLANQISGSTVGRPELSIAIVIDSSAWFAWSALVAPSCKPDQWLNSWQAWTEAAETVAWFAWSASQAPSC